MKVWYSLPCIFLKMVTLIQGGKSCNPGVVLDSPAPCDCWSSWRCFSYSWAVTEVSSVLLSLHTKPCNISCHLILSFSSLKAACLNEQTRMNWSWALMSCSSACLGVWSFFSWLSVLKAALHINSGGCPLSSTLNTRNLAFEMVFCEGVCREEFSIYCKRATHTEW